MVNEESLYQLNLKVLNRRGSGSVESLIEAIHYANDWRGIDGERVRVSLGLKHPDTELYKAIIRAIENNMSVVAASGNNGGDHIKTHEYRHPGDLLVQHGDIAKWLRRRSAKPLSSVQIRVSPLPIKKEFGEPFPKLFFYSLFCSLYKTCN